MFRDTTNLMDSDPTPAPIFSDFGSNFRDFSRLYELSLRSQRALLGEAMIRPGNLELLEGAG